MGDGRLRRERRWKYNNLAGLGRNSPNLSGNQVYPLRAAKRSPFEFQLVVFFFQAADFFLERLVFIAAAKEFKMLPSQKRRMRRQKPKTNEHKTFFCPPIIYLLP
jgi:hypothetical protein